VAASQKRIKALRFSLLYLEMRGFKVIEQDYRTLRAVVDLIVMKDEVIYFIEVKVLNPSLTYQAISGKPVSNKDWPEFVLEWQKDSSLHQPVKRGAIELLAPSFAVFSFNYGDS